MPPAPHLRTKLADRALADLASSENERLKLKECRTGGVAANYERFWGRMGRTRHRAQSYPVTQTGLVLGESSLASARTHTHSTHI